MGGKPVHFITVEHLVSDDDQTIDTHVLSAPGDSTHVPGNAWFAENNGDMAGSGFHE
jgi:hypothetical protein